MYSINKALITNGFIKTDDTYILSTTFGTFTLRDEYPLNKRYTGRQYIIENNNETLSGIIYTNNPESFTHTLNRLLRRFYSASTKNLILNSEKVKVLART
ncbi:hypothetical protein U8V72_23285 [Priestia filamentosa]|uniref:hypothetical protein n=1 Tax=Priestia filamentosa TaxID=1402861 RepID=UPI00058941F2